jgi:hypothetical protein
MTDDVNTGQHRAHPDAEHLASLRLLLGILADADCARRRLTSTREQTEETLRWYRARFDLLHRRDLERFLAAAHLGEAELIEHMRTFTNISIAQGVHGEEVDRRMPRYQGIFRVRDWLVQRESRDVSNEEST